MNSKIQQLYATHKIFNNYFFDGMLNHPKFILEEKIGWYEYSCFKKGFHYYEYIEVWGYFDSPITIGITTNEYWQITLLHEMIHQYQYEFNMKDKCHGNTFHKYARCMEKTLKLKCGTIMHICV